MKLYIKPVGVIGTNCYIAADDQGKCAVIDPGAQPEKLAAFLKEHDYVPEVILLTHGHFDHIGAVKALAAEFSAQIVIGERDAEQLADPAKSMAGPHGLSKNDYVMEPDKTVKEGEEITVGDMCFSVLDTPGHTRGGVTYRCEDFLFTGDTLFAGSVGRTDLYGGDYGVLMSSVRKLSELQGDFRVLPGHGPDTTLDIERRINPYMKEAFDDRLY